MILQSRRSTWPLFCILSCLFILSAIAPRSWKEAKEILPGQATTEVAELPTSLPETIAYTATVAPTEKVATALPVIVPIPEAIPELASVDTSINAVAENIQAMETAAENEVAENEEDVGHPWVVNPAVIERDDESWLISLPVAPVKVAAMPSPKLLAAAKKNMAKPEPPPPFQWTEPAALMARLEELVYDCSTGDWAIEVRSQVHKLGRMMAHLSPETPAVLASLENLAAKAPSLAESLADAQLARDVTRARYALERRLGIWRLSLSACDLSERAELLKRIEQFEQSGLASDGAALSEQIGRLDASSMREKRALGQFLEDTYGNANLRVNVCQSLLNRFIPTPAQELGVVNDTVLGRPVYGNSLTSTGITVEFVPDNARLRMAFCVSGGVASLTSASAGPARFVSGSEAMYFARKDLEIRADGILLSPAAVSAENHMQLRSVETDLDWIPLVGLIAQNVARSQHEANQPAANQEVEEKISEQARTRIDNEVYSQLNAAVVRLREHVFTPLNRLSLEPTMISAETTKERLVTRLRLAGSGQVGGYTPRPRDPDNCLVSVQLHESAINNFLQRLDLDGRTLTLPQCARQVSEKLNLAQPWVTDPDHDDVIVTFAPHNAIAVRCQDGQVAITLSIARLSNSNANWRDFQAKVYYQPVVRGRSVQLVRDGVIQLISPQLGNRCQLAVRGIFSTLFPKDRAWDVVPERFVYNEHAQDLAVTQMVIEDGWFALAIGPDRLAQQPATERR